MIAIVSIIHSSAVRVDSNVEASAQQAASESAGSDPKAEALTLIVHKYPPSSKVRPLKVIERADDVVVIHSNRPKRRPSSRNRRPSSNQYRSKIKSHSPGSSSHVGGFKDYSQQDFRFPPFPSKNFGEPPRASNKYKYRPQAQQFERYNFNSQTSKKSRKPTTLYGPPPQFNQYDYQYDNQQYSSTQFDDRKTLQTLQQQQANFPSYSIDTVEPSSSNFYPDKFTQPVSNFQQPISNFPLDSGSSFNSPKTSYGNPVRASVTPSSNSFLFNNPSILGTNLNANNNPNHNPNPNLSLNKLNANLNNLNANLNSFNTNFPKLPNRYEQKDFSTPTRTNPLAGNHFNDFTNYNDVSETQNIQSTADKNRNRFNNFNTFNKFNNFDYDFKGNKNSASDDDDDDDGNVDYIFTTRRPPPTTTTTTTTQQPTTTRRPKKNKRKRPAKIAQFSQAHNLDTDDLRDAFTESSDFHEVALSSDDFINFDSQRNNKRHQSPQYPHEIHSTLKTARKQSSALRTALGDDFQIVSIHKSLEKDPNLVDFEREFGFQRKNDQNVNAFSVGSEINFGAAASPVMWSGDFKNFPRNHRFA